MAADQGVARIDYVATKAFLEPPFDRATRARPELSVEEARGAVYYPPAGFMATLLQGIDPWLGRRLPALGAFIAVSANKPPS